MIPVVARRRAVTLIEAVLFISIALGLIIGGLVFFQQAQTASRTQETVRLVNTLITAARAIARTTDDTVFEPALVAGGHIPEAYLDETRNIVSPWGGSVSLDYLGRQGDPPMSLNPAEIGKEVFEMWLYDVPPAVCARIAVVDENGNGRLGTGLTSIYTWQTGVGAVGEFAPIPPDMSSTLCHRPDFGGGPVNMELYFIADY
jgi:hypothetical protein